MVYFCDKCSTLIVAPKDGKLICPACKYEKKLTQKKKRHVTNLEVEDKADDLVIQDQNSTVHPIVDAHCKRCGHNKAYFWTKRLRSSDEPDTQFFKCVNCGKGWRDGGSGGASRVKAK